MKPHGASLQTKQQNQCSGGEVSVSDEEDGKALVRQQEFFLTSFDRIRKLYFRDMEALVIS